MARPTDQELQVLESEVAKALASGDRSALTILGFGEISVALGHPMDAPTHVCKRMPPFPPAQFATYANAVHTYVDEVRAAGIQVVESEVRSVPRDGLEIAYLVQPLLAPESLGDKILAAAKPDPEHPFLVAVGQATLAASRQLSIDAQVTNWSWDGSDLTLLDVGTPFLWDSKGDLQFDMTPFLAMLPAPTRRLVRNDLTKMMVRWQEPKGVAIDVVANLFREGLGQWVDPTIIALNTALGTKSTITRAEAHEVFVEDMKTWPRLEKLKHVERTWRTKVRRKPYDFFIQSTYDSGAIS